MESYKIINCKGFEQFFFVDIFLIFCNKEKSTTKRQMIYEEIIFQFGMQSDKVNQNILCLLGI